MPLSKTLGLRVDWSACAADWPRSRLVTVRAALSFTRELAKTLRLSIVANQGPEMYVVRKDSEDDDERNK